MLEKGNAYKILLRDFNWKRPVGKFRRNVKVVYKTNFEKAVCDVDWVWSNLGLNKYVSASAPRRNQSIHAGLALNTFDKCFCCYTDNNVPMLAVN
jgi:hypothetical protein